jgi:hypothetical protein
MELWDALVELSNLGKFGAVVIIASLVSVVLACGFVVYDTAIDTYRTVKSLRKNKKTKN